MQYRSAIDAWFVALVIGAIALPVIFPEHSNAPNSATALMLAAFVMAVIGVLTWPCRYTLADDHLHIRCGFLIRMQIPYSDIRSVKKSNNPLAAPALSLRRVRIDHGSSFTLISPRDRDEFVQELCRRSSLAS